MKSVLQAQFPTKVTQLILTFIQNAQYRNCDCSEDECSDHGESDTNHYTRAQDTPYYREIAASTES